MQISLESTDRHAVQAYSHNKIQINSIVYEHSLIVSKDELITELNFHHVQEINDEYMELLLKLKPELVVIGHAQTGKFPPFEYISKLSQLRIGIECMSIGAACRTFNVLLSEHRSVVAGFIL